LDAGRVTAHHSSNGHIVLLTGATGFVGKVVLHELLRRREELGIERVVVLLRADDHALARTRFRAKVLQSPCFGAEPHDWQRRVDVLAGDVTRQACGLDGDAFRRVRSDVTHVIHCAASVEFSLSLPIATDTNVTGALRVLELAKSCSRIVSFVNVSTAYVTPHPSPQERAPFVTHERLAQLPRDADLLYGSILGGRVDAKRLLAETGHPNTYTFTKCLAEHLLVRRAGNLPLTLLRPSIVSASRSFPMPGWIDSPAAFAAFVALVGTGRLRVVAGDPEVRLDIVPCDEVARRAALTAFAPPSPGAPRIVHAVAGLEGASSLDLCREQIVAHFEAEPDDGRPRLAWLGRRGARFRLEHGLRHEIPLHAAAAWSVLALRSDRARMALRLLERQRAIHREFAYFTHATFDFRSSMPLDPPLEPVTYLKAVCAGVQRHLLRARSRRAGLAESRPSFHVGS
jgi:alcohol-forming fatty acyl-CoA reductase